MNIPRGKYGPHAFVAYVMVSCMVGAAAIVQAIALAKSVIAYNSPAAVHARLVKAYDKEKDAIVRNASDSATDAAMRAEIAAIDAESAATHAKLLAENARDAEEFLASCRAANALGTDAPPVDCSTIPVTDAEPSGSGSVQDAIDGLGFSEKDPSMPEPLRYLFVNWGHGMSDNGKWEDNGATAPDGTTERSVIIGVADTLYNHMKDRMPVTQVGRKPYSLRENTLYASRMAMDIGCGAPFNKSSGPSKDCYLVSVHANSSQDQSSSGFVAYYNPFSVPSRELAESLAQCMGGRSMSDERNRHGRLSILRDVENVDAVLVESGYLTNPSDLAALKSGKVGSRLAKCAAKFFDNL